MAGKRDFILWTGEVSIRKRPTAKKEIMEYRFSETPECCRVTKEAFSERKIGKRDFPPSCPVFGKKARLWKKVNPRKTLPLSRGSSAFCRGVPLYA